MIKKILNYSFIRFGIVGVLNTILGISIMFGLYNLAGLGYWGSSAISYILASVFSYFMNKHFTFKSDIKNINGAIKFSVNIAICYLTAYIIAKPSVIFIAKYFELDFKLSSIEQIAMIVGMVLFVINNYFGQKLFVFKKNQ